MWVAAIAGTIGAMTLNGFILDQPSIQVFEQKPKVIEAPTGLWLQRSIVIVAIGKHTKKYT